MTLFLYLNTLPEGQGHTSFPSLGLSIRPQRGCGVLFCNILPDGEVDIRTVHRAEPVEKGLLKYGVNVWFTDTDLQAYSLEKPTLLANKDKRQSSDITALQRAEEATLKRMKCSDSSSSSRSSSSDSAPIDLSVNEVKSVLEYMVNVVGFQYYQQQDIEVDDDCNSNDSGGGDGEEDQESVVVFLDDRTADAQLLQNYSVQTNIADKKNQEESTRETLNLRGKKQLNTLSTMKRQ